MSVICQKQRGAGFRAPYFMGAGNLCVRVCGETRHTNLLTHHKFFPMLVSLEISPYISDMSLFDQQTEKSPSAQIAAVPLAERMRPRTPEEFVGQGRLMAPGAPLRKAIETDTVGSLIFWGPPGSGKTSVARIISRATSGRFISFSAVRTGIKEVKELLVKSGNYSKL